MRLHLPAEGGICAKQLSGRVKGLQPELLEHSVSLHEYLQPPGDLGFIGTSMQSVAEHIPLDTFLKPWPRAGVLLWVEFPHGDPRDALYHYASAA